MHARLLGCMFGWQGHEQTATACCRACATWLETGRGECRRGITVPSISAESLGRDPAKWNKKRR